MWRDFASKRERFIGGVLQNCDPLLDEATETEIVDVGFDGKIFTVQGKDYGCSINRKYGGLSVQDGWFVISGPMMEFRFKAREVEQAA